jgi:hypothetical protein
VGHQPFALTHINFVRCIGRLRLAWFNTKSIHNFIKVAKKPRKSRVGNGPLKAEIRVRIPVSLPIQITGTVHGALIPCPTSFENTAHVHVHAALILGCAYTRCQRFHTIRRAAAAGMERYTPMTPPISAPTRTAKITAKGCSSSLRLMSRGVVR